MLVEFRMKVFVVTFYGNNYGSSLQAFALQSQLRECGYDSYLVSYPVYHSNVKFSPLKKLKLFLKPEPNYSLLNKIRRKIEINVYKEKNRKIDEFITRRNKIITYDECLKMLDAESSILLSGSDQVWSVLNGPIPDFYLCNFGSKSVRRMSYAASIGLSSLSKTQKEYYKNALKDFNVVSFREKHAYEILGPVLEKDVRVDVDPTLLYSKEFWDQYCSTKMVSEKYIFVYMLRPDKELIKTARLLARSMKCKIIYMGQYNYHYYGIQTLNTAGVEDFISCIKYAEAVLTNSFHGTVFSILYGKKFANKRIASTSSRAENLLKLIGLEDHLIDSCNNYSKAFEVYDVESVWRRIDSMRLESISYLKNIGCYK